jgi:alpha/beta hydrolase fold
LYAVPDEKKKPGYQELRQAITHKLIESYNTKKEEGRDRISDPLSNSAPVTGGVKLDTSKIALSGFSSGGNLALEPALNVGANPPLVPTVWPSPFSLTHIHPIPLLLFYPSLDGRLLPSERTRPPGLPATKGFWTELSDTLAPTYLSREEAPHPRASPGLADILDSRLHEQARISTTFVLARMSLFYRAQHLDCTTGYLCSSSRRESIFSTNTSPRIELFGIQLPCTSTRQIVEHL